MAARSRRSTGDGRSRTPGSLAAKRGKSQPRRHVRQERQALYRRIAAEAAERIFADKGSGQASMQEIAAEAGLSLATIYGVVDGKDGLLLSVHEWRMREFLDRIRSARDAHAGTLDAHLAVLLDGADFFLEHPDFLRLCCRDGYGWASGLTPTATSGALWTEGIAIPTELFRAGIAEGIYVDEPPGLLARKMLALKQVELTHWVEEGMTASSKEVRDRLEAQFVRAFCTPGALEATGRPAATTRPATCTAPTNEPARPSRRGQKRTTKDEDR